MSTPTDGGPAFPFKCQGSTTGPEIYYGMTLRDWFAGQSDIPWNACIDTLGRKYPARDDRFTLDDVAKFRAEQKYREADAMLAARERKAHI